MFVVYPMRYSRKYYKLMVLQKPILSISAE